VPEILPLYPQPPRLVIEQVQARSLDQRCSKCSFGGHTRCMSPARSPGVGATLLVVSDYPGQQEDAEGRPFVGDSGRLLRRLVSKLWSGPVVYDNCIRCFPGRAVVSDRAVESCRGYLAAVIQDCRPSKVLVLGGRAIYAMTGRALAPLNVRKGYTWMVGSGKPVPVHLFPNAVVALRNRHIHSWLEEDLRWALTQEPPWLPALDARALVVKTLDDALEAERQLLAAPWFAHDVETAGRLFSECVVLCGAMAIPGSNDVWVWDRPVYADRFSPIHAVLIRLMESPLARKVGSNFKHDQNAVRDELGCMVNGAVGDTRLARKLLESSSSGDLETMAELVGMGGHKAEAQQALEAAEKTVKRLAQQKASGQRALFSQTVFCRGEGDTIPLPQKTVDAIAPGESPKTFAYAFIPRAVRLRYNALDALATARLQQTLIERMDREDSLTKILHKIVLPAAEAIQHVERWGVAVDHSAMQAFDDYASQKLGEVRKRLEVYGKFNPGSFQDVARVLFKDLGLTPLRETQTGYSTDNDTLEALESKHPIVPEIIEWRRLSKLHGTYGTGLLQHIRSDGRIHPSILLDGAATGRTSCQSPNLQNIVRDSGSLEGKMIRDCFIAPVGYRLLQLDYSQLELRVAAMLSGDPVMLRIFEEGVDFHRRTAELICKAVWGIDPKDVTKAHRTVGKTINFGILFGIGDEGLAAQAGCSVRMARQVREEVMGTFKVLASWIKERLAYAKRTGYCWTWWDGARGRRRSLWQIADQDHDASGTAERGAWNGPIQGTGSDFCVASLAATVQWILEEDVPVKLVLPVHDSLLLEAKEDYVDEAAWQVYRIMTGWRSGAVKLEVDVETGPAWGSMVKYPKEKLV